MYELDSKPILDDLGKAMDALTPRKAPGKDDIHIEIIRYAKGILIQNLHEYSAERRCSTARYEGCKHCQSLQNKGDRSDCNSYQGIFLLSIIGKLFTHIVLKYF